MRKPLLVLTLLAILVCPVKAADISAPSVPENVEQYMPQESVSFGKDLWYIVKSALSEIAPEISNGMAICASVIAVQLLVSMMKNFTTIARKNIMLSGTVALSALLLGPSKTLIHLGVETIQSITEYNKMLLPALTAALASQGGTTTSTALYAGTMVLDTLLSTAISKFILPCLYVYISFGIAYAATQVSILKSLLDFMKWLLTWLLKITVYVFTGYMGITGVISGTVDAAAVKATKLAISGTVPVIGNIISDASESVLVSAGIIKNASGVYGALAILAICISPFLKIGIQYLLLRITAGISSVFADKTTVFVVEHISTVMGFVLAMTGTVCLLFLMSIVCFMKGMS